MAFLRKVIPVVLIVTVLSAVLVSPAAAAPAQPQTFALNCDAGACKLAADASGVPALLRNGAGAALSLLPFGRDAAGAPRLEIDEDVTLTLPIGDLKLSNAQLEIERAGDGSIERLHGTADMPFPTFGLLDDVRVVTPARAEVGLELGKNLSGTNLDLDPDRPYLFFNADTAFDVAARTPGNGDAFSLSLTPGQRAMLVIDTVDAAAYLDGQVTLSNTDQVALLGGALEGTAIGPYVPDTLPIRERTQFGLSGKFSKDLSESHLTLSGAYVIDGGFIPARLGIEAKPVQLQGTLDVSRAGVLVDGVAAASIEPETVFDGGARIQAFIPFPGSEEQAYARFETNVEAPIVRLAAEAGAEIGAGGYALDGRLATPFTENELSGKVSGKVNLPDVAGVVGPVVGKATTTVGSAAGKAVSAVGGVAQQGLDLAGNAVSAGKARLSNDD